VRTRKEALTTSLAVALLVGGCGGKMSKINKLEESSRSGIDALAEASRDLPSCGAVDAEKGPDAACLANLANALGSKSGFHAQPADQASSAAAAVLVARDGLGYAVPRWDAWLDLLKNGKGPGVDALRMAVASGMAKEAPIVGQKTEDEAVAKTMMRRVAARIPGACPTYELLGAGKDNAKLAPELRSEHSTCVQKHLSLRDGPGGRYGSGTFRAAEGAMALWRETERTLRQGLEHASPEARDRITKDLAVIEPATQRIGLRREMSTVASDVLLRLGEAHAEAGVPIVRDAGAPKDGSADAR
jgi:hypothetical protein